MTNMTLCSYNEIFQRHYSYDVELLDYSDKLKFQEITVILYTYFKKKNRDIESLIYSLKSHRLSVSKFLIKRLDTSPKTIIRLSALVSSLNLTDEKNSRELKQINWLLIAVLNSWQLTSFDLHNEALSKEHPKKIHFSFEVDAQKLQKRLLLAIEIKTNNYKWIWHQLGLLDIYDVENINYMLENLIRSCTDNIALNWDLYELYEVSKHKYKEAIACLDKIKRIKKQLRQLFDIYRAMVFVVDPSKKGKRGVFNDIQKLKKVRFEQPQVFDDDKQIYEVINADNDNLFRNEQLDISPENTRRKFFIKRNRKKSLSTIGDIQTDIYDNDDSNVIEVDDDILDFVENDNLPTSIKRSTELASTALEVHQLNISKREFEHSSNIRFLSQESYQLIFIRFNNDKFEEMSAAILLLSLVTAIPVQTLLNDGFYAGNHLFSLEADLAYLSYDLAISDRTEDDNHHVFMNDSSTVKLPIGLALLEHIIKNPKPTPEEVANYLAKVKRDLAIPNLSVGRIESALHVIINRMIPTGNQHFADIICRIPALNAPGIFYSSHDHDEIVGVYLDAIAFLDGGSGYAISSDTVPKQNKSVGSQQALHVEHVSELFIQLTDIIKNSKDIGTQFNAYAMYIWYLFCVLTGARPNNNLPGSLDKIDLNKGLMILNDKKNQTYQNHRLVVLCDFLCDEIKAYQTYLRRFKLHSQRNETLLNSLYQIDFSKRSLLNFLAENKKLVSIKRKDIQKKTPHDIDISPYWTRHFTRTLLEKVGAPLTLINSIIGHQRHTQESLNQFSSVSKQAILSVKHYFTLIVEALSLKPVDLKHV